jgi:hypothetical protein
MELTSEKFFGCMLASDFSFWQDMNPTTTRLNGNNHLEAVVNFFGFMFKILVHSQTQCCIANSSASLIATHYLTWY